MAELKRHYWGVISLKQAKKIIFILIIITCFDFVLFPVSAWAVVPDHGNDEPVASQQQVIEATGQEPAQISQPADNNSADQKVDEQVNLVSQVSPAGGFNPPTAAKLSNSPTASDALADKINQAKKAEKPKIEAVRVKKTAKYMTTAYNSEVGQTDDSPCITANGFNLCQHGQEDTVAANFLPFGAKVRLPDHFGDKIFIVRDRMNARYSNRLDIWMLKRQDALKFGARVVKVEILE